MEALDNAGDWSKAESKAEEILALNPGTGTKAAVLWSLIIAEANNQKYDEAVQHAKEMIPIDPLNGHFILGRLYYELRQFDLSKAELLEVKNAGSTDERIDQMLSDIEKRQGQ